MVTMGAEGLTAAFHAAPMRSELSNIWNEALHDDEDDEMDHTDTSGQENTDATAVSPSPSSSSSASSPGLPSQTQQQQQQQLLMMNQQALLAASSAMLNNPAAAAFYYPMNPHMNDFGAFLASSTAAATTAQHQPTPVSMLASGNTAPTNAHLAQPAAPLGASFLDDLLSSTDDMDFRVRGSGQTNSNNSSANFMLPQSHSLPPSIQQQLMQSLQMQRQSTTSPGVGTMSDSSFLGLDGATADGDSSSDRNAGIATRLLQLENNYERKKKRAKINRKDLNARFQDLMDILNLKEDRKLNRAKILEKTIEYIEKLEDELHAIRSQADAKKATNPPTAVVNQSQSQQQQTVQMMLQNPAASHAMTGGGSLLAFDPTTAHAWTAAAAAGASSMPMTPMMWLPCSIMAPPISALLRGAPPSPPRCITEKKNTVRVSKATPAADSETVTTVTIIPDPADGAKRSLKRARDTSAGDVPVPAASLTLSSSTQERAAATDNADSAFVWSAQEIPTFLAFCDAWTLVNLMQTSQELGSLARQNTLWIELCRRRWRLGSGSQLHLTNACEQVRAKHFVLNGLLCGKLIC